MHHFLRLYNFLAPTKFFVPVSTAPRDTPVAESYKEDTISSSANLSENCSSYNRKTNSALPVQVPSHVASKLTPVSPKMTRATSTKLATSTLTSPKQPRKSQGSSGCGTPSSPKLASRSLPSSLGLPSPRLSRIASTVASKISPTSKSARAGKNSEKINSCVKSSSTDVRTSSQDLSRSSRSTLPQNGRSSTLPLKRATNNLTSLLKPKSAKSPPRNSRSVPPKKQATMQFAFDLDNTELCCANRTAEISPSNRERGDQKRGTKIVT